MAEDLFGVLEEERRALLEARWEALPGLLVRKETCLAEATFDRSMARRVHAALARNQTLLSAALGGLRDARARLSAVRTARTGLRTYDAAGRLSDDAGAGGGLARKM